VASSEHWTTWQTVTVAIELGAGDNLSALAFGEGNHGSINIDYVALG
jgi:hypothetical protein